MRSGLRLNHLAVLLMAFAVAASGVFWWRLTAIHEQLRASTVAQTGQRASQLAEVQAGRIETLLLAADLALKQFRDARQAGDAAATAMVARTALQAFPEGAAVNFLSIDARGYADFSTAKPGLGVYFGDREYFKYQSASRTDRLYISKPLLSRASTGRWVLPLTRPILRGGRFAGVVSVAVSPEYLAGQLAQLKMGPRDSIALLFTDGAYVARTQNLYDALGRAAAADQPFVGAGAPSAGVFRDAAFADQVPRLVAWRRLQAYPLAVTVGLEEAAALAPLERVSELIKARAMAVIAIVLALSAAVAGLLLRIARQQQALAESEAMLRSTLDSTDDGILVVDDKGAVVGANRLFYELWRIPPEIAASGQDEKMLSFVVDQLADPEGFRRDVEALYGSDAERQDTLRFRDGRIFERYTRAFLLDGRRARLWSFRDATLRRHAEIGQRLAASVFANSYEGVLITDARNVIVDINPAFSRITGYAREDVIDRTPRVLASGRHGPAFFVELWTFLLAHDYWSGEIWNRRKGGEVYPQLLSISAVRDEAGALQNYVAVFTDISLLKKQEAELDRVAHYDPLTGVPNRRLLADRLRQAIAHGRRSELPLAVCYLDLDGFKPVNDRYGHATGDGLLTEIAGRLQASLRADDTLARLGGDEFVLLLVDLPGADECHVALSRVLAAINTPVLIEGTPITISASIGVTYCPPDEPDGDILLRHADQAMYRAKEAGRNRYQIYEPTPGTRGPEPRSQAQRLGEALQQGELVLHYQPKVDLYSGEVIGVEALMRWRHPEAGLLLPGEYLHDLADSDLEIVVGDWVVESTLQQIAAWREAGMNLPVSVNVSARHLLHRSFVERLRQALARYPTVRPGDLEMEIVESAALGEMDQAVDALAACRALGVRFALDDFGTGYSSLAYFRNLPIDVLKIDQSFVRGMLDDPSDLGIVEGVVRLAQAFNRPVIAEGVETMEHGALLIGIGCRLCQGYGIARPMAAEKLPGWLEHWKSSKPWLGLAQRGEAFGDPQLVVAGRSHHKWIERLVECIEQHEAQTLSELDPRHCRFGHWYQAGGMMRYGTTGEFQKTGRIHEEVHELGAELLERAGKGEVDAARRRLPELYALQERLLQQLDTLAGTDRRVADK